MPLSNLGGIFAVTKLRLLLFASLVLTWWTAHLSSKYTPALQDQIASRIQGATRKIPSVIIDWSPNTSPRAKYNESKMALLIEPRPLPHLVPLILHMIAVAPPDWPFLFIGSPQSVVMVERSQTTRHHQIQGKLELAVLPDPWRVEQKEGVFRLLTDIRFYNEMLPNVEWLFKYESDSILCANSEKSLDAWLDWSWAGLGGISSDRFTGTGGLSIRRVSAVRRVLAFQGRYNNTEPEDVWFVKRLKALPGGAPSNPSLRAPVVDNTLMENPMGYHLRADGTDLDNALWQEPAKRKQILGYCPELSMIMDMKMERERCPDDNLDGTRRTAVQQAKQEQPVQQEQRPSLQPSQPPPPPPPEVFSTPPAISTVGNFQDRTR